MAQTVKVLCYNPTEEGDENTYALESGGGEVIVQYEEAGVPEQLWTIEYSGMDEISLLSVVENLYLNPGGDNSPCTLGEAYFWNLAPQPDGQYAIRSTNAAEKDALGIVLDAFPQNLNAFDDSNQPNSGDTVGTWTWGGGNPNEVWTIADQDE